MVPVRGLVSMLVSMSVRIGIRMSGVEQRWSVAMRGAEHHARRTW